MTNQQRIEQLISSRHACVSIVSHEEEYALSLIRETAFKIGRDMRLWSIVGGVRDGLVSDLPPVPETEHAAAALYHIMHQVTDDALFVTLDLASHLEDQRTQRLLRDLIRMFRDRGATLIMIDHSASVPDVIRAQATPFDVTLPDEKELDALVRTTLKKMHQEKKVEVAISKRTFRAIVRSLRGLTRSQAEQIIIDCVAEDRRFDAEDLNTVLALKRQALERGGLLEFIETPVDLSQIGGLKRLKRWLKQRQESVTDAAVEYGLVAPRGVLMLGVQGAGKSLCAKAIATAWQRPLLRLDPGALYDRYVGESERRLRDALQQAEMMAPIVLWIDEIEKGFASASGKSNDGGLSQRMFGTLLTWMQEHQAPVFLVATANEIDTLPPELLRKGRFDEIFFVDLPGRATRKQIFGIHLKKRKRDASKFDLDALADAADGFSGAEIEQAVIGAMHDAFADKVELATIGIVKVVENSPPLSVTMAERINELRQWAKNRCVPAD